GTLMQSCADEVHLDFDRRRRTGLDEAVFAHGKSPAQLDVIFAAAHARNMPLLVTRLSVEKYTAAAVRWSSWLDYCAVSATAFFGLKPLGESVPRVAIVAAGTSDAAVAREAERTLAFNGVASASFIDVGVAGLWRLTTRIDAIGGFPVVIAVAGMDAALPTVLGGLIPALIIAVPTSVGYGVAAGGHTALNAILASCAPGMTVVNIDNGYGAACAALRALRMADGTSREVSTVASHRQVPA
ncbi:MAG: circadian phase modifier CpmA, partial [Gammaproteobacteria bacterium]|nr:circadian phase modifier CpmA [Gammaproteobacteria bacterium]